MILYHSFTHSISPSSHTKRSRREAGASDAGLAFSLVLLAGFWGALVSASGVVGVLFCDIARLLSVIYFCYRIAHLLEKSNTPGDVDKAGAVYDAALDAREWRTTAKGKHFELETETGEITKGNIGQEENHFGPAFPAFKGKPREAIEHLLKEKSGHVPGAFRKEGLGDIDLPYGKGGKDGYGLAHIIERRNEQNQDGEAFARNLPSLIQEGKVEYRKEFPGRAYVVHEKSAAVIRLDWDGQERKWMVTAYPLEKKISGAQDGCRTCVLTFDDRQSFPLPYAGVRPAKPQEAKKKGASGGHGKFSQDTCLRKPGLVFSRPGLGAETAFLENVKPISQDVKLECMAQKIESDPGMEGQA